MSAIRNKRGGLPASRLSSTARMWVIGFAFATLSACSGRATLHDAANISDAEDGGNVDTTTTADARDGSDDDAVHVDAPGMNDGPREIRSPDGPPCPSESDHGALTPSGPACTVTPVAVDAPSLCSGAASCPVGAMFSLKCIGSILAPSVVPTGGGGSVMVITNSGSFVTRLFSMVPGAPPRVDDVPALTWARSALSVDSDGNPTIFGGVMPDIWRVRKTPFGWRREVAVNVDLAVVTDARAIDANRAFVAYYNYADELPRIAIRDGSCWSTSVLPGTRVTAMGLDVDRMNRPWVSWFGFASGGVPVLDLVGPDGPHRVWTSSFVQNLAQDDRPIVMADGFAGTAAYPALAMQRLDGVHILIPDTSAPRWTDHVLAGSALAIPTDGCPPRSPPFEGCSGRTTCTTSTRGAIGGFGVARTTAGRAYAAWLSSDGETDYALSPGRRTPACPDPAAVPGPNCICNRSRVASRGTGTVVIVRVDTASPTEVLRLTFDTGGEQLEGALALASRGNTLLLVASLGIGNDTALRYLEIDTAQLP